MQALELKIPPPVAAVLVGLAMWWTAHQFPPVRSAGLARVIVACAFPMLGLSIASSGFWSFRRAKTTVNPVHPETASSVVTTGIFGYTRNPMYVGLALVLTGWAVWLSVPWVFLGPIVLVLFLRRFQIVPEERAMSLKFGRDYDDYRKRVRRWI
jgi:protein-S-isoprenylcysteine O-methyltransferase Ste14